MLQIFLTYNLFYYSILCTFANKKEETMCESAVISDKVVKLSRRSYNHRLEIASPRGYQLSQLQKLNKELDKLYELIYDEWNTITEEDYKVFGEQLVILTQTIKQLYNACKRLPKHMGMEEDTKKLGMNFAALYELNSDIVNFRIKTPKSDKIKQALQKLSEVDANQKHPA